MVPRRLGAVRRGAWAREPPDGVDQGIKHRRGARSPGVPLAEEAIDGRAGDVGVGVNEFAVVPICLTKSLKRMRPKATRIAARIRTRRKAIEVDLRGAISGLVPSRFAWAFQPTG